MSESNLVIKEFTDSANLDEIYQKSGLRFSFLSKDGEQCHPWVKCRDYLHDIVKSQVTKKSLRDIYGLSFNPKKDPNICLDNIKMVVKNYKPGQKSEKELNVLVEIADGAVRLLNHYEGLAKLKQQTTCKIVEDKYIIFEGPSLWLKSPVLTSMFTFLIRLGARGLKFKSHDDLKDQFKKLSKILVLDNDNDRTYLTHTFDKMCVVIKYAKEILQTSDTSYDPIVEDKEINMTDYHDKSGIYSLCKSVYTRSDANTKLKEYIKIDKELEEELAKKKEDGKAKLTRIVGFGSGSIYEEDPCTSIRFSLVTINDAGERVQCHKPNSCREYTIGYLRAGFLNWKIPMLFNEDDVSKSPPLDTEKLRLLVTVNGVDKGVGMVSTHKKELFFSKRVLNFYEHKHGIPLTKISTVKIKFKKKEVTGWLFIADKTWIESPVMFSLYCLILRSARLALVYTKSVPDNIDDNFITKLWDTFKAKSTHNDANRFGNYVGEADKILKNRKILFTSKRETAFGLKRVDKDKPQYYKRCGFDILVKSKTANMSLHFDKKLIARYRKLE